MKDARNKIFDFRFITYSFVTLSVVEGSQVTRQRLATKIGYYDCGLSLRSLDYAQDDNDYGYSLWSFLCDPSFFRVTKLCAPTKTFEPLPLCPSETNLRTLATQYLRILFNLKSFLNNFLLNLIN
jgi:hypothetical protein